MKKILLSIMLLLSGILVKAQAVKLIIIDSTDCDVEYTVFAGDCFLIESCSLITIPSMSTTAYGPGGAGYSTISTSVGWCGVLAPPAPGTTWTAIKFAILGASCMNGTTIGDAATCGYNTSWSSSPCLCGDNAIIADWTVLGSGAIQVKFHY